MLNRGSELLLVLIGVFIFPLYYVYDGEHSGLVIAKFAAIASIVLEVTLHWRPRLSDSIPCWTFLVPAACISVYWIHGLTETLITGFSLLLLLMFVLRFARPFVMDRQTKSSGLD